MAGQTLHCPYTVQQTISSALQGAQRPLSENADGARDRTTWDIANQNLFWVLLLRRPVQHPRSFAGSKERGPKMDQNTVIRLGGPTRGCNDYFRDALRAEHHKMNHTKITPGQGRDQLTYIMNICRDRLTSTPPEYPTHRCYKDIILQALSPHYESIQRAHLKGWDFSLADIRQMIAIIYADNLSHQIITSAGIAGSDTAMKAMDRDLGDIQCHN